MPPEVDLGTQAPSLARLALEEFKTTTPSTPRSPRIPVPLSPFLLPLALLADRLSLSNLWTRATLLVPLLGLGDARVSYEVAGRWV